MNIRSWLFVSIQFAALGFLLLTEPLQIGSWQSFTFLGIGFLLGIWALWAMRASKFGIFPEVSPGSSLVTHGPYAYIRHPMYTGLILIVIGLLIHHPTTPRLIAGLILAADLILKARYEEQLLHSRFSEYATYQKKTYRLIPFLY